MTTPRRRWTFSLKALLALPVVVIVGLGIANLRWRPVEYATRDELLSNAGWASNGNGALGLYGERDVSADDALGLLSRLGQPRDLDLANKQVTDVGLGHLTEMTGLRVLVLSGTKVSDAGLIKLKGLSELTSLDLRDTGITDAGLQNLKGLANLGELYLGGTKVTDAGVEDIQKALPRCIIWR